MDSEDIQEQTKFKSSSKWFGSSEGKLEVGGCELVVPPGALEEDVEIKLTASLPLESEYLETPTLHCEPASLTFKKPVTIKLQTHVVLDEETDFGSKLLHSDDGRNWEPTKTKLKFRDNFISFQTNNFSWWRLRFKKPHKVRLYSLLCENADDLVWNVCTDLDLVKRRNDSAEFIFWEETLTIETRNDLHLCIEVCEKNEEVEIWPSEITIPADQIYTKFQFGQRIKVIRASSNRIWLKAKADCGGCKWNAEIYFPIPRNQVASHQPSPQTNIEVVRNFSFIKDSKVDHPVLQSSDTIIQQSLLFPQTGITGSTNIEGMKRISDPQTSRDVKIAPLSPTLSSQDVSVVPAPQFKSSSKWFGSSGGKLEVGGCELVVPPGALEEDVEIKLTASLPLESEYLETPTLHCEPASLTFKKQVTIKLQTHVVLDKETIRRCKLLHSDDGINWEETKIEFKFCDNFISFQTNHFSWWKIVCNVFSEIMFSKPPKVRLNSLLYENADALVWKVCWNIDLAKRGNESEEFIFWEDTLTIETGNDLHLCIEACEKNEEVTIRPSENTTPAKQINTEYQFRRRIEVIRKSSNRIWLKAKADCGSDKWNEEIYFPIPRKQVAGHQPAPQTNINVNNMINSNLDNSAVLASDTSIQQNPSPPKS